MKTLHRSLYQIPLWRTLNPDRYIQPRRELVTNSIFFTIKSFLRFYSYASTFDGPNWTLKKVLNIINLRYSLKFLNHVKLLNLVKLLNPVKLSIR